MCRFAVNATPHGQASELSLLYYDLLFFKAAVIMVRYVYKGKRKVEATLKPLREWDDCGRHFGELHERLQRSARIIDRGTEGTSTVNE